MDPYIPFLLGLGGLVLLASWAPLGLKRLPLPMTLPIMCVALGAALFGGHVFTVDPSPRTWDTLTERLTELVVIVSLMGAGLKLDRQIGWRRWSTTWPRAGRRCANAPTRRHRWRKSAATGCSGWPGRRCNGATATASARSNGASSATAAARCANGACW